MLNDAKYEQMALVMKALAHPTRLFIIDKLHEKEHCVCELQDLIGYDLSTISRHLTVLRQAGIIASRKHNNQVIYRLLCPCILSIYDCMVQMKKDQDRVTQ